jgi:ribosome-binding ATPase YchF (GTP1/OBG family)
VSPAFLRDFLELHARSHWAPRMAEAKSKGWGRMEGKEYVMQDGDVVEFRFNV